MISPLLSVLLMTSLYLNSYQRGIDRALKSIPLCEKHLEAVKVSSTLSSRGRATQRVIEISPFETGIDLKYTLSHECAHIIDHTSLAGMTGELSLGDPHLYQGGHTIEPLWRTSLRAMLPMLWVAD